MSPPATQPTPDEWDRKAERVHGEQPSTDRFAFDTRVAVTKIDIAFSDVFFIVLMVTVSQAIIAGLVAAAFSVWYFNLI